MHGFIILGNDNKATRILIKTMHDSRTLNPIDDGWVFIISDSKGLEMMKKSIYKGSFASFFSGCWMSIDTGIFIDDSKIFILKHDIKWNIFCNELHGFYFPLYLNYVSSVDFFIFCKVPTIGGYLTIFNHLLDIAPRLLGKKSRQVSVDSSSFSCISKNTEQGSIVSI